MSAESWYFEDFELDPSAYRLRRDGEVVRLERIPFELLCLLIEQHGRVVIREEILERSNQKKQNVPCCCSNIDSDVCGTDGASSLEKTPAGARISNYRSPAVEARSAPQRTLG